MASPSILTDLSIGNHDSENVNLFKILIKRSLFNKFIKNQFTQIVIYIQSILNTFPCIF